MNIEVDRSNLLAYAKQALSYEATRVSRVAKFSLPKLSLNVRSNSEHFMDLCQIALASVTADENHRNVTIDVIDSKADHRAPLGIWTETGFAPAWLEPLRAQGIEVFYDFVGAGWQFFDRANSRGVQIIPNLDALAPWERSFPLKNFLHWEYAKGTERLVHAGSLAIDGAGVLLIGAGGSGKSGTTLSGICAGLGSSGDDYVALEPSDNGFAARPVIRLMKQDETGLRRNGLSDAVNRFGPANWQNKHEFDFETLGAGRRVDRMKIVAIVRPQVSRADTPILASCGPLQVMQQLTLSTLAQLPGEWRTGLEFLSRLVRSVPCYTLKLSEKPEPNIEAISSLIEISS